MRLCEALGVGRGEIVAFIGAGGKTSSMARLGQELKQQQWRVLATTTTRIAAAELAQFPHAVARQEIVRPQYLSQLLTQYGLVFVYERLKDGKVIGLAPEAISQFADSVDSDAILIEADGSRRLPLKAPLEHEPVIPADASLVVPIAGFDAVGKPFDENTVYNIETIIEHYGFPFGTPIHPAWIAQILRDDNLGLRGIPPQARVVALLNKCGTSSRQLINARRAARLILQQPRVSSVLLGQVQTLEPIFEVQRRVGAIVLAGGLSSRMGSSKPLLPWGNKTIIETIVGRLLPLRFSDIVVVTGYKGAEVAEVLKPLGVRIAHNPDFATGEMVSSLQTGLQALEDKVSACMVFLGDQPQINARLVNHLLVSYARGQGTIVAPSYQKRRGHPILIDRRYWREMLELGSGAAPRDVINAYPQQTAYVVTDDPNVLQDMDTPEEYQAALKRAGLL